MEQINNEIIRKSATSIMFMTISMFYGLGIGIISRFALAAQLDASIFGNFTVAVTILGIVISFMNTMGDRFIVVTKYDQEKVVNTVFTTEIILWMLLSIGWFCLSPFFWRNVSGGMSWGLASLLLLQGLSYPLSRPRALLERALNFKTISIVNIVTQSLFTGIAIILAFYVKNELPLIVTTLTVVLSSIVFIKVGNIRLRLFIDPQIFREYIRLCLPLMASGFLVFVYWNGDRLLLDQYVSRKYIGYYGWAFSLGIIVIQLKGVVGAVIFPVFAELMRSEQNEKIGKGLSQIYRTFMLIIGLVVPVLFVTAPYYIRLAGEQWIAATECVQIAILIFSLRSLNGFLEPIFITYSRSHQLMYIALLNACIILLGGWVALLWMPKIEIMASIILSSCIITFLICIKVIYHVVGINLLRVIVPGLTFALLSGLLMYALIHYFGSHILNVLLAVVVGCILYVACMWKDILQLALLIRRYLLKSS